MAKSQKESGLKKGAPHHFTGDKRVWLDSKSPNFHLARASGLGEIAAFYDDVTRDFLFTFPNIGGALEDGPLVDQTLPNDTNSLAQQSPAAELTQTEADASTKLFDMLRLVSLIFYL